jgi:hypothetical protein
MSGLFVRAKAIGWNPSFRVCKPTRYDILEVSGASRRLSGLDCHGYAPRNDESPPPRHCKGRRPAAILISPQTWINSLESLMNF